MDTFESVLDMFEFYIPEHDKGRLNEIGSAIVELGVDYNLVMKVIDYCYKNW